MDNSLIFTLRDKLNAGTLTPADAKNLQAAIDTLDANEAVNRSLDRINPGAFSLEGAADRNRMNATRTQFDQALATLGGTNAQPGAAAVGRTVNVNINTPAGRETVTTDEQGAASLVRTLQKAGLAARG